MLLKPRVIADDNTKDLPCYQYHDVVAGGSENDCLIEAKPGQFERRSMHGE